MKTRNRRILRLYPITSLLCVLSMLLSNLALVSPNPAYAQAPSPSPSQVSPEESTVEEVAAPAGSPAHAQGGAGTASSPSGRGQVSLPGPMNTHVNVYTGNL